jgi:hypothetical protein
MNKCSSKGKIAEELRVFATFLRGLLHDLLHPFLHLKDRNVRRLKIPAIEG